MKKVWKGLGIVVGIVVVIFVAYVVYVFMAYERLPDQMALEVEKSGEDGMFEEEEAFSGRETYSVMTYNIGFGAYLPEYSFFMDGGKSSWGKDEESVAYAVNGAGGVVGDADPDFVLLQEVDRDGTRSYHIDELELLKRTLGGYYYVYAQNYDSPFLFFPPWEPHGANKAGLVSLSKGKIAEATRRSLPISESFSKFVDLDRCYSISRIPVRDGKMLCLYNMHMSAYGSSDEIRTGQLTMLYEDMEADYQAGNYVICGGDFNHNLRTENEENAPEWAHLFPRESLPEGFRMAMDEAKEEADIAHNTCRSAREPYDEAATYTVTLDGFIVSDNVRVESYQHMDCGYRFSDHDPVVMEFSLE